MALQQPTRRDAQKIKLSVASVTIPDKLYFRIGEVARLCALPTHVLRFWESEFPQLKPHKGGTGQRLYRKRDVEMAMEIKRLLYDEKFTIAGALRTLTEKRRSSGGGSSSVARTATQADSAASSQPELPFFRSTQSQAQSNTQTQAQAPRLQQLRGELREILGILDGKIDGKVAGALPERSGTLSTTRRTTRSANRDAMAATPEISAPLLF